MKARTSLIGAIVLVAPIASTMAQAPTAAHWQAPVVGERCTAQVTTKAGEVYTRTVTYTGPMAGNYCFDVVNTKDRWPMCLNAEGNVVEMANTLRSPHSGAFAWPLTVGKEWEYSFSSRGTGGGPSANYTKRVKVLSYEPVAAGGKTYDAFRIEATGRRIEGGYYPWTETVYYAPVLGKLVKYESSSFDNFELLGCSR